MIKNTKEILTRKSYEAPVSEVLRLQTEGIVCLSGGGSIDDAIESDFGEL